MKRKSLLIMLFAVTLTFTGCGKEETPVLNNNVETEVETEKETEPIVENEPIIESETETITRDEIAETTTETDTTIEVDINGVDGAVEEGDYDEEVHAAEENKPPAEGTDEFQQMLEEMAKEIYNSNGGGITHIPADPEIEAQLGGTYGTTESTDPDYAMTYSTDPDLMGGSLE